MALLKSLHFAGLLIWCAGLLYLPTMLLLHGRVQDQQEFARIRMASRFGYLAIVSPAAFIAVSSGIALLFLADALHGWMFLKLVAVSALVIVHMRYGRHLSALKDREEQLAGWRPTALRLAAVGAMATALFLVLAKPDIPADRLPAWMLEPGLVANPPWAAEVSLRPAPLHRHRA